MRLLCLAYIFIHNDLSHIVQKYQNGVNTAIYVMSFMMHLLHE